MKKRLVENFSKDWNVKVTPIPITLNEKTISLNEKQYTPIVAYKIPVWRLGEKNKNGRRYKEELGRKIVQENKVTTVLDGHPAEDDYDPKLLDIIAIAKNPSIQEKVLWTEVYFVNQKAADIVQKSTDLGLMFEQSSSGFGELDESGDVVTDTYELERYVDILIGNSSYNVGFGKDNKIEVVNEAINESVSTIDVTRGLNPKDCSLELTNYLMTMKEKVNNVENIPEIEDKIIGYQGLLEWCNGDYANDIRAQIDNRLNELNNDLTQLAIKGKKTDMLEKQIEEYISDLSEVTTARDEYVSLYNEACNNMNKLREYCNLQNVQNEKLKEKLIAELNNKVDMKVFDDALLEKKHADTIIMKLQNENKELTDLVLTLNEKVENHEKVEKEKRLRQIREKEIIEQKRKEEAERLAEQKRLELIEQERLNRETKLQEIRLRAAKKQADIEYQETQLQLRNDDEVSQLYRDWYREDANIEKIKDKILACKTVNEAQIARIKNKHLFEEDISLTKIRKQNIDSEGYELPPCYQY